LVYIASVTPETPQLPKPKSGSSRRRSSRSWLQLDTTKTCSACGKKVARQDCHKNRFGEYICRTCQQAGITATKQSRSRAWLKRAMRRSFWGLMGTVLTLMVLAMLFLFSQ
jgi:hypothetical protein